jgi:UDP-N-acetyl-D-mannosaminuronic acid dehydrogenase
MSNEPSAPDPRASALPDARDGADVRVADVCVVGLGYVGLTLSAALAEAGLAVLGYERQAAVCARLDAGQPHLHEPGVERALCDHLGAGLRFTSELPDRLPPVVVLCVGTPADRGTGQPDLEQIAAAAEAVAARADADTLVVVRSTVPVGTCRGLVLPALRRAWGERHGDLPSDPAGGPQLAMCPERTIQGQALEELRRLPQIVGGVDERSAARAAALFGALGVRTVRVSSLEAAETVKLICNAHTDTIYGFGNEVALMAEALGLDALELIRAANLDYPRPDLCRPGYVGGACLTKDPYLLISSTAARGYTPPLIAAARQLNQSLPERSARRVLDRLAALGVRPAGASVFVSGFAYKGVPETDDLRGAPIWPVLAVLRGAVGRLRGHDFVLPPEAVAALGVEPVELAAGFAGADAVLLLNNHPAYRRHDVGLLAATLNRPAVLYDSWGVYRDAAPAIEGVEYLELGRG